MLVIGAVPLPSLQIDAPQPPSAAQQRTAELDSSSVHTVDGDPEQASTVSAKGWTGARGGGGGAGGGAGGGGDGGDGGGVDGGSQ